MRCWKFIGLSLIVLSQFAFANQKITLATSAWEPYVSDDPAYHGYVYEIIKSAYDAEGYDVDIRFMSWEKALRAVRLGIVDGIFPEYYSSDRAKTMVFSQPFSGGPIGFYKLSGSEVNFPTDDPTAALKKTLQSMDQYRFGAIKGYTNIPAFDHAKNLKKVMVSSDKENLEQLYSGQVDLIIIDKFTADYLLKHELPWNYQIKLSFMPPALGYKELHLAIKKNHPKRKKLLKAFNTGLHKISRNGLLSQIIDRDAVLSGEQVA